MKFAIADSLHLHIEGETPKLADLFPIPVKGHEGSGPALEARGPGANGAKKKAALVLLGQRLRPFKEGGWR